MREETAGPASRRSASLLLLVATLAAPVALPAQDGAVTWDLPAFHSPYSEAGAGLHVSLPDGMDGFGASAAWRFPADVVELEARAGMHVADGELAMVAGGGVRGTLARAAGGFPVDVAGVAGAGLGWMPQLDVTLLRMPVGVSVGRRVPVGAGSVAVYAHPRLGLDAFFSPLADDLSVHADVDLGLDVQVASGLRLRAAVTVGHREALGVGVLLP